MWIRTKRGRLFNLDCAFDVYANDPRNEVGGRTYTNWTVVARSSQFLGVVALCDSQEDAEAVCRRIWDGIRERADVLDLADGAPAPTQSSATSAPQSRMV